MSIPQINILNEIAIECEMSQKMSYKKYVFGAMGEYEGPKLKDDILEQIELCQQFEQMHEKDNEINDVYVDDQAFPDHQLHDVWQYHQKYDEALQEYDVIIAKKAFAKAFEENNHATRKDA